VYSVSDVRQIEVFKVEPLVHCPICPEVETAFAICYQLHTNFILRLSPYIDEIIGDHNCRFLSNRSSTAQIFCIRQILEKQWEYNETVHQLFIDFNKAYKSVRREVLYNIHIEFGAPVKLVRLIKMCLSETYNLMLL
jgi:hypothetical protein